MTNDGMRATRTFLASFLVLFLEIALIRWMPAYIRLLSYFSNFILLASFLGIGIGCLLAPGSRAPLQLVPGGAGGGDRGGLFLPARGLRSDRRQHLFLERHVGKSRPGREHDAPAAAVRDRGGALRHAGAADGTRDGAAPAAPAYTINLAGSLAGVVTLGVISWLELPPPVWFGLAFAAAVPLCSPPTLRARLHRRRARSTGTGRPSMLVVGLNLVLLAGSLVLVYVMARGAIWSPYYKITVSQSGPDTVVEVNNIFHQSMAPVEQKEYFYQWPYSVFGDTFEDVLILGAGSGTDVAAALRHGVKHVDAVEIDPAIIRLGRAHHPDQPYSDPRVTVINDDARHYLRTTTEEVRPGGLRADRFADDAVELFGRAARELHVHGRVVPRRPQPAQAGRRAHRLQLLPRALARRSPRQHRGGSIRTRTAGPRPRGPRVSRCADGRTAPRPAHLAAAHSRPGDRVQPVARAQPGADARTRSVDRAGVRRLAVPLHARSPHSAALRDCAGDRAGSCRRCRSWPRSASSARAQPEAPAGGRGSSSCSAPASCCSRPSRSSSLRCCGARPGWWPRWRSPPCSRWRSSPTPLSHGKRSRGRGLSAACWWCCWL